LQSDYYFLKLRMPSSAVQRSSFCRRKLFPAASRRVAYPSLRRPTLKIIEGREIDPLFAMGHSHRLEEAPELYQRLFFS
jgi:hypothetical protein